MTVHRDIPEVIERCKESTSVLAIFQAPEPHKFNVLFADTVQTTKDIKAGHDDRGNKLICIVNVGDGMAELAEKLKAEI